jgi:protein CpxP
MKSTLKLTLAAMLLGLSVASLLRAADQSAPVQTVPVQTGPSIQPEPATPPGSGEKPQHMMDPERVLKMLTKKLSLTDDQQAKVRPLLQAQADQVNALHDDASLPDDEKREKFRAIRQSTFKQIGDVLTPEQKGKFKDMRPAHDKGSPPPPPADGPPPPPPGN